MCDVDNDQILSLVHDILLEKKNVMSSIYQWEQEPLNSYSTAQIIGMVQKKVN